MSNSETISLIRFPLAVMVVFIHSFGTPLELESWPASLADGSLEDIYNIFRVAFSRVLCHCAVPIFYLLSGWLFFQKLQEWHWHVWKRKVRNRIHSLVIPYFVWIILFIIWTLSRSIGGGLLHGDSVGVITDWIADHGGFRMFWDSHSWNHDRVSLFGVPDISTSPILVPFWFLRDLIVQIILSPIIWLLFRYSKNWLILLLTCAYLTSTPLAWHGI